VFCREGVARLIWVPIFELSLCSIIASGIFGQLEGSRFPSDVCREILVKLRLLEPHE
jgi:hypothetical protein